MDPQFKPVMNAAYAGDFTLFKSLLEGDLDLITQNSTDLDDSPNLIQFIVVEGGLGKIPDPANYLTFLIDNGSTTEKQLVAAASVNSRELVDTLIEAGVPLNDGAPWTAVEESLYWGHLEMADYLLNVHGAKLNTLCACAMIGNMEKLTGFFQDGKLIASVLPLYFPWGELKGATKQGAINQAFMLALSHKQYEVASYLLDRGVEINALPPGCHEGCTPLHQAIYSNDIEMVDWLMDRGAVANINNQRFSADAITWAKREGHTHMEEHLKKRLAQ